MAELHVVSALVERYRRLSFELNAHKQKVEALKDQLWHLEVTIKIFNEDFDFKSAAPKRTVSRVFHKRNIFMRTVMDILRDAREPLSAVELTHLAFEAQGDANPKPHVVERYAKALNNRFIGQTRTGEIVAQENVLPWKWQLPGEWKPKVELPD